MRLVHVNYDAVRNGGATIAMLRTIEAQRLAGIDVSIVCRKAAVEEGCHLFTPSLFVRAKELGLKCVLRGLTGGVHSTGLLGVGVAEFINAMNPDIVQLNWLQANTLGVSELKRIKCPIVWFTHDLWPMRGLSAYADPNVKHGLGYAFLDKWVEQKKIEAVQACKGHIYVVGPSEWARSEAIASRVFADVPSFVIHYPVSKALLEASDKFNCKPKKANSRFTILFGATTGISSRTKGWDRLMSAVDLLPETDRNQITIRVFGCNLPSQKMHGVDVEFIGKKNISELVQEYRNADLFALPSRSETWGQTKTEALCCGTPVIAFDQTACANGIIHKKTGWIAGPDDIESFARGIQWFVSQWRVGARCEISDEAARFSPVAIGREWVALYEKILRKEV